MFFVEKFELFNTPRLFDKLRELIIPGSPKKSVPDNFFQF